MNSVTPPSAMQPMAASSADTLVLSGRPLRAGCAAEATSRFSDDVWDLTPALLKKHDSHVILDFGLIPASCRQAGKELCWAMLSGTLPPGEDRPAVSGIRTGFTDYVRFLRWTAGRTAALESLTGTDLEDYQRFLISALPNLHTRQRARSGVRKFWLWRDSMPSGGLRFDPLHLDGWSAPKARAGENATDRIPEEVLGPLFVWAMRFIDDFSADILAADRHWRRPVPPGGPHPSGQLPVQLQAWLDNRIASGQPLPGWRGRASTNAIAIELGRNRMSLGHHRHLIDEAAAIVGTTPQTISDQPVIGRLDGQPWIEAILADHIESDSLASLARLLQDAAYIALAYLSGARDSELKHLQRGCLTVERDADGRPYRWKMRSLAFKGENDPSGVPATWSIGEPAARAISVLEQLQPPGTRDLFARLEHSPGSKPGARNPVLTSSTTNARLNAFAAWVNDYCERHGRADGIPPVRDRPWHLATSQFRPGSLHVVPEASSPGRLPTGIIAFRFLKDMPGPANPGSGPKWKASRPSLAASTSWPRSKPTSTRSSPVPPPTKRPGGWKNSANEPASAALWSSTTAGSAGSWHGTIPPSIPASTSPASTTTPRPSARKPGAVAAKGSPTTAAASPWPATTLPSRQRTSLPGTARSTRSPKGSPPGRRCPRSSAAVWRTGGQKSSASWTGCPPPRFLREPARRDPRRTRCRSCP